MEPTRQYITHQGTDYISSDFTKEFKDLRKNDGKKSRQAVQREKLCQPGTEVTISSIDDHNMEITDYLPDPEYMYAYLNQFGSYADIYMIHKDGPFFFSFNYSKTDTPIYKNYTNVLVTWGKEKGTDHYTRIVLQGDPRRLEQEALLLPYTTIKNVTHLFQCERKVFRPTYEYEAE